MEKNKKMWIVIILIGIISVTSLTIALALGSQQLDIGNEGTVDPRTFKVEFQNLGGTPTLTNDAEVITTPTLTSTLISGLKVKLPKIGSQVAYTFDVVNTGAFAGEIDSISFSTPNCEGTVGPTKAADESLVCTAGNIIFTLKYTIGGADVDDGDTLTAGQTRNMTLTIGYLGTATMPDDVVEISDLDISIMYIQS